MTLWNESREPFSHLFEQQVCLVLAHDLVGERLYSSLAQKRIPLVFFLPSGQLRHRVGWQAAVANCVVKHGGKLVADVAQVRIAEAEPVGCPRQLNLVLSVQDVHRCDLRELLVPTR